MDVIRRHRLIETSLVQTLKLDWSIAHADTKRIEHASSPSVLEALDEFLGQPSTDLTAIPSQNRAGRSERLG